MSTYPDMRTALIALIDLDLTDADFSLMPIVNAALEAGEAVWVELNVCNGMRVLLNVVPDNSLLIAESVLSGGDIHEFHRVAWTDGRWVALGATLQ